MSGLGEVVFQLGSLFIGLIDIYIWVLIISALLSFVNPDPYNPIVQFLNRVTQPVYSVVRKVIQTNFNGIDLAPLVVIIALQVVIIFLRYGFSALAHAL